jgi:hypothetical protein
LIASFSAWSHQSKLFRQLDPFRLSAKFREVVVNDVVDARQPIRLTRFGEVAKFGNTLICGCGHDRTPWLKCGGGKFADTRSMTRTGDLAERTQAKLEGDYQRKIEDVKKLERELTALRSAPSLDEAQAVIGGVLDKALAGDVKARARVAQALPAVISRLVCRKDGVIRVEAKNRMIKVSWTITDLS